MTYKQIFIVMVVSGITLTFLICGKYISLPSKMKAFVNTTVVLLSYGNTSTLYHQEKQITSYYGYTEKVMPPEKVSTDKYIIYRCQNGCGGLADRQKGIVTAYVLSQMLRRKFGIIMNTGCEFSKYVIPNEVNWIIKDDMITGRPAGSQVNIDDNKLGIQMRDGNLESMFNKDVMYYQGNIEFVHFLMNKSSFLSLPWTKNQNLHNIYRTAFAHLFKLAPTTMAKFNKFKRKVANSSLFCAHLRMGQSKTLPDDMKRKGTEPYPTSLIQFLKANMSLSSKLFIATDSDDVRKQMKDAFPLRFMETEGKIVHIDRFRGSMNCPGMEKAILDQFILTKCDTLVTSKSGFSEVAASLRGTDERLYLAVMSNITRHSLQPTRP